MSCKSIVWFKTNLRLADNAALVNALATKRKVIPLYCFDPSVYETLSFGFKRTGSFKTQFLLESLQDLDANLRQLGSGLVVVIGNPVTEIPKFAAANNINKIFAQREIAYEEKQTELALANELHKCNCEFIAVETSALYALESIPFTLATIPDIFTEFRKKVEKEATVAAPLPVADKINSPTMAPLQLPALADLGLSKTSPDSRAAINFTGGENAASERLDHYFFQTKALSKYKETRNGLIGANYSSKFSPWLSLGCVSARQIYYMVKQYEASVGANESTYWLIFELLWREYFRLMMEKYGRFFFLKHGLKKHQGTTTQYNPVWLDKWINGKTGNDFIDANMTELNLTGFMSNRGRQNVASYLVHDLKQDWRYGAAYFEQQLIDYDVSSNWCNWAYVAGVGNDPRPNRYFNTAKQASDYDPDKNYRKLWLPKI